MSMFIRSCRCLQQQIKPHRIFRSLNTTTKCLQEKEKPSASSSSSDITSTGSSIEHKSVPPSLSPMNPGYATHRPNGMEKKFLLWTGRYKTADDIPPFINQEVMERVRNTMRIRIATIMMALTAVGCVVMIISGKNAAERGETVAKQNLEWHKLFNESERAKENKENKKIE